VKQIRNIAVSKRVKHGLDRDASCRMRRSAFVTTIINDYLNRITDDNIMFFQYSWMNLDQLEDRSCYLAVLLPTETHQQALHVVATRKTIEPTYSITALIRDAIERHYQ